LNWVTCAFGRRDWVQYSYIYILPLIRNKCRWLSTNFNLS
jgi:hypothetical protein